MQIKSGYKPSVHSPEHKVFGADNQIGGEVLNPSGQWTSWLPSPDVQQNIGIEPECCTSEGTVAPVEILKQNQYGDATQLSARFLAWASKTTPQGNDPATVANTFMEMATCTEEAWPNTSTLTTWADFYMAPPQAVIDEALEFKAQYAFGWEWVSTDPASLMAALQYSPVSVSGYAWDLDTTTGLYITPPGAEPCHWFTITGYVEGQYWWVFDSYQNDIKKLAWDYVFSEAMRYSLTTNISNPTYWQQFLSFMNQIISAI